MITIEVVRTTDGRLVGRTFSDRWNLLSLQDLGREHRLKLDINKCENNGQLSRLRRTIRGLGFTLAVLRSGPAVTRLSPAESAALKPTIPASYRLIPMRISC